MGNFDHLKQYDIAGDTRAEYTLYQLDDQPTLVVAPATTENREYSQAALRRNRKALRPVTRGGDITMDMVDANMEIERDLYGQHIVKGWRDMRTPGKDKKEIPFTRENAVEFIHALPAWIFQELRAFCSDPRSFLDDGEGVDEEELAGNS